MANELFESHYQHLFGERWPSLRQSLLASELQVARENGFSTASDGGPQAEGARSHWEGEKSLFAEFQSQIPRDAQGLLRYYILDPASVFVARALEVRPGDRVLDMCAAPGGKSLILAEALCGQGELHLNEISAGRRERLKKVLQQYMSREQREIIKLSGKDGGLFAKSHLNFFDRILIDAPCSGERHLLRSKVDYMNWSPSRVRSLAQRQYALLTAGLLALKPGGCLVYSTCALNPEENDGVINRLLEKKGGFQVLGGGEGLPHSERTKFGCSFFPDKGGLGPMYFAVLKKDSI